MCNGWCFMLYLACLMLYALPASCCCTCHVCRRRRIHCSVAAPCVPQDLPWAPRALSLPPHLAGVASLPSPARGGAWWGGDRESRRLSRPLVMFVLRCTPVARAPQRSVPPPPRSDAPSAPHSRQPSAAPHQECVAGGGCRPALPYKAAAGALRCPPLITRPFPCATPARQMKPGRGAAGGGGRAGVEETAVAQVTRGAGPPRRPPPVPNEPRRV